MPGGSKKGHAQGTYDVNDMKLAVRDVLVDNKSQKAVAKKYAISRQTLHRHVAKANEGKGVEKLFFPLNKRTSCQIMCK